MQNKSAELMKVAVTGASGFIGSALTHKLCEKGYDVRGVVRLKERLLNPNSRLEIFGVGEINSDTNWGDALKGIDVVIHLAARVHMMKETDPDPLAVFRYVNVAGTKRLAIMAAKAGVRRFVFLSSLSVNGSVTHEQPFTEEDDLHPQNPYALSKLEAEKVLHSISAESGMEVVIIRAPLVYGPGVKANFLRMVEVVNRGIPLPLASVNNRRSFIYLDNLVDAIIRCIEHPAAANQTFLVSDGQDISTPELIRMIARAMGKKARLFPCPVSFLKMIGNVAGKSAETERLTGSLWIDSAKIRRELSWTPPFTMEQGIRKTADWFKRQF